MAKKIFTPKPIEEIQNRLPLYLTIDPETYKGSDTKCKIIDSEYGEFWAKPGEVARRGSRHPNHKRKVLAKLRTKPIDEVKAMLPSWAMIDESTYTEMNTRARFIDKDYGEFWALPLKVIYRGRGHKQRGYNKRYTREKREHNSAALAASWDEEKRQQCGLKTRKNWEKRDRVLESINAKERWANLSQDKKDKHLNMLLNNRRTRSNIEEQVRNFVTENGLECEKRRFYNREIDIYIPSKNIGIEVNGAFFHSEFYKKESAKSHLLDKTNLMKKHGIRLIHIYDYEIRKNWSGVQNFLFSLLNIGITKIHGRKCSIEIGAITDDDILFVNKNHIQPTISHNGVAVRLTYLNEMVGIGIFRKHHRNQKEWCLSRLCFKSQYQIVGGLSKIVNHFIKYKNVDKLISWCDLRISTGESYLAAGWKQECILLPDYKYIRGQAIVPKQRAKKKMLSKLIQPGETEKECMTRLGYNRFWDCGKIRFIYQNTKEN